MSQKKVILDLLSNYLNINFISRKMRHEGFGESSIAYIAKKNDQFFKVVLESNSQEIRIWLYEHKPNEPYQVRTPVHKEFIDISFVQSTIDILKLLKEINGLLADLGFSQVSDDGKFTSVYKEAVALFSNHTYLQDIEQTEKGVEIAFNYQMEIYHSNIRFKIEPSFEGYEYRVEYETSSYRDFELNDGDYDYFDYNTLEEVFDYIQEKVK